MDQHFVVVWATLGLVRLGAEAPGAESAHALRIGAARRKRVGPKVPFARRDRPEGRPHQAIAPPQGSLGSSTRTGCALSCHSYVLRAPPVLNRKASTTGAPWCSDESPLLYLWSTALFDGSTEPIPPRSQPVPSIFARCLKAIARYVGSCFRDAAAVEHYWVVGHDSDGVDVHCGSFPATPRATSAPIC